MSLSPDDLKSATEAFDLFFAGNIIKAREAFTKKPHDPYHLLGMATCSFLEAVMSMEDADVSNASTSLDASFQLSTRYRNASKLPSASRFPTGLEWDVLVADATVLSGLVNVFSETYAGYFRCVMSLLNARSKFTKLYNTVFPNGLDSDHVPLTVGGGGPPSNNSLFRFISSSKDRGGSTEPFIPQGPLEEFIVSGTAFGFGLFNLALSLLPRTARRVVNMFITSDQRSALRALRVAATKNDAHSVFARLVLMLHMSLLLQMTPWQADSVQMREEFHNLLDPIITRYPNSNLWALYQAKLMRVSNNQDGAIAALKEGTKPGRPFVFKQADMMVVYELGWTLVGERKYREAAKVFMKTKELNQWSHATYHFLAAGCYIAIGKLDKGQKLLDDIPNLESKKIAGKLQPTEVFLKKKLEFYQQKHQRSGRPGTRYVESIKIGLAEELGIFWNNYAYVSQTAAREQIDFLSKLTPTIAPWQQEEASTETLSDLDTPDELAVRSLLLGILYRTLGDFATSRIHLTEAYDLRMEVEVSTWVGGLALFELAALDLTEMDALDRTKADAGNDTSEQQEGGRTWKGVLQQANRMLDEALYLSSDSVDLSSRLDSRISLFKEEIRRKGELVGVEIR
ncbi:hypothetical protein F5887DRAFT_1007566 [Amanita rubescens]|nr:hypothetical protein F5887DRAFT_1007566 [Amanita rubescens]